MHQDPLSTRQERANALSDEERRSAFKVASYIFRQAGEDKDPVGRALIKLASEDPGPVANRLALAVFAAIGKHEKQASRPLAMLTGIGRALVPGSMETALGAAKLALIGSAAAGGAVGAGVLGTQRLMEKDEDKNLKLMQEKALMKKLSDDVRRELQLRKLAPTPENTAAVVDYLT